MAKRKSLNKRLSRYSKCSIGSAILDPDTGILGEEQPYWWKNLENNTIVRPSIGSSSVNQTSRQLDSKSLIEANTPEDGWWKVLETTNTVETRKVVMNPIKQGEVNNMVSSSESEEEPRIRKRKFTLRSKTRKSQDQNAFLSILNDSTTLTTAKSAQEKRRESSVSKSISSNKGDLKHAEASNLNQSQSADNILKLKPRIFRNKHMNEHKNIFEEVLKESELPNVLKRKSLGIPIRTESPIIKQGGSEFKSSFENEHDFSHLPLPEAQSTLLESCITSSSQGSNNNINDTHTKGNILKPKSMFLKRHNRNMKKNAFEDILTQEQTHNESDINKLTNKSIATNTEDSTRTLQLLNDSPKASKLTGDNVSKSKATNTSEIKKSKDSVMLNDTSDTDENINLRVKSKFLGRQRRNIKRNFFEDILNETEGDDLLKDEQNAMLLENDDNKTEKCAKLHPSSEKLRTTSRNSKDFIRNVDEDHKCKEGITHNKDEYVLEKDNRMSVGLQPQIHSDTSDDSVQINEHTRRRRKSTNKTRIQSSSSGDEDSDLNDSPKILIRLSRGLDRSEKRLTIGVEEVQNEEIPSISKTQSTNSSEISLKKDEVKPNKIKNISGRQKRSLNKSSERSPVQSVNESEVEDIQITPKKKLRSSSKLEKLSALHETSKSKREEEQNMSKRQSEDLRKSGKRISRKNNEVKSEEMKIISGSRQENLSNSSERSPMQLANESEVEDIQITPKKKIRSSSKLEKLSALHETSRSKREEEQNMSKRQSEGLRKSGKRISRKNDEVKSEEMKIISGSRKENLSNSSERSPMRLANESEVEDTQATPKKKIRSSSKLEKLLALHETSRSKREEEQNMSKRQSEGLRKSGKRISRKNDEVKSEEMKIISGSRKENLSNSSERSPMRLANESEVEDTQATPKKKIRSSSKLEKLLALHETSKSKRKGGRNMSKRQSKPLRKSQKRISRKDDEVKSDEMMNSSESQKESLNNSIEKTPVQFEKGRSSSRLEKLISFDVSRPETEKDDQNILTRQGKALSNVQTILEEQRRSFSGLQKRLFSPHTKESQAEERQYSLRKRGRSSKTPQSEVLTEENEVELDKIKNISERQEQSLNESSEQPLMGYVGEFQAENVQTTSEGQKRSSSRLQRQSSSPQIKKSLAKGSQNIETSEAEVDNVNNTAKSQSENLNDETMRERSSSSSSQKQSFLLAIDDNINKLENNIDTQEKNLKDLNTTRKLTSTPAKSDEYFTDNPNFIVNEKDQSSSDTDGENASEIEEYESDISVGEEISNKSKPFNKDTTSVVNVFQSTNDTGPKVTQDRRETIDKPSTSMRRSTIQAKNVPKRQARIEDFLKVDKPASTLQVFSDKQKMNEIKQKLEEIKKQEIDGMKHGQGVGGTKLPLLETKKLSHFGAKQVQQKPSPKKKHAAYLVNGVVYKAPRLPRPKHWITDRLYNYLWKCMEPKYKLRSRVISEKFVRQMTDVTTVITKQKSYAKYKVELHALMKEMARLGLIRTRHDFYNFCHDFLPYELRIKMVPMLLPGNKRNIPYDGKKLYTPILS